MVENNHGFLEVKCKDELKERDTPSEATKLVFGAKSTTEAKQIFLKGQSFNKIASEIFHLDGWASEHITLCIQHSALYRYLSNFENDPRKFAFNLKCRHELLAPLIDKLNPEVFRDQIRQLAFEVGQINHELHQTKVYRRVPLHHPEERSQGDLSQDSEEGTNQNQRVTGRYNDIGATAVRYYERFINTYRTNGRLADNMPKRDTTAIMTAMFAKGKILATMGVDDKDKAARVAESIQTYEEILSYFKRNSQLVMVPWFKEQYNVCQEMVKLLVPRLAHLRSEIPRPAPSESKPEGSASGWQRFG
eukprot:GHVN01052648.1.p1 GENE.GHVN01052648.1~~GHVN01052648.1.p1  ORF type:complete len:305 (-),score=26.84 GHVN01052648.1:1218-2132(-)